VACLAFLISSGTRGFFNDDRGEAEISTELYFELGLLKIGWTWETLSELGVGPSPGQPRDNVNLKSPSRHAKQQIVLNMFLFQAIGEQGFSCSCYLEVSVLILSGSVEAAKQHPDSQNAIFLFEFNNE